MQPTHVSFWIHSLEALYFYQNLYFQKMMCKNSITLAIWWNLRIGMWKSIYFSFNLIKHSYFQICINSIDIFVELKQQKIFPWPDEFYRNKNLIHFSSVLQHKSTLFQSLCKFWKRYIIQKREWFFYREILGWIRLLQCCQIWQYVAIWATFWPGCLWPL